MIKDAEHIHFIGIGGIGISALAKMLVHQGKQVSGINDSESPETLDELRHAGVHIEQLTNGQGESLTIQEADVYVYSVAWEGRALEVLEAAHATGKPVLTYFEALGEVAKGYKVIAVAGTHGKTTTTAMTAQALIAAGLDPTVIVGSLTDFGTGVPTNFRAAVSSVALAKGEERPLLLIEACEYKRHFLNFHPHILAVTNIEFDHPDYYQDLADVEDAFAELASQSEIVLAEDSINARMLSVPELKVLGEHNRANAALALAICDELGLPAQAGAMDKAKEALAAFTGTWRRLEYKGKTEKGAIVYDDYAHHPTAIKATLKTLRDEYKDNKIVAVFEAHMFSRTQALFDEFAESFTDADEVIIAPIYAAREPEIEGITAEALAKQIPNATHTATLLEAVERAQEYAGSDDIIIFMSAGDIFQEIPKILK